MSDEVDPRLAKFYGPRSSPPDPGPTGDTVESRLYGRQRSSKTPEQDDPAEERARRFYGEPTAKSRLTINFSDLTTIP